MLDKHNCPFCEAMDGRTIEKDSPFGQNTIFHSNCRDIWVAIMNDETDPPKTPGITKVIRDRFGGEVNALLQLPR